VLLDGIAIATGVAAGQAIVRALARA